MQMERAYAIAVYVHVYVIYMYVYMAPNCGWFGAAARMQIMRRICGCDWL